LIEIEIGGLSKGFVDVLSIDVGEFEEEKLLGCRIGEISQEF